MTPLRFKMMGPLEFHNGKSWATLSAPKWRTALALLLINRNQIVSMDQLVDELWGTDLPSGPVKAAQVYISRVRQSLNGNQERLVSRASGYGLELDPAELDSHLFEEYVTRAQGHIAVQRPDKAINALEGALALCRRGPALTGVPGVSRIPAEATRLEELRRSALQTYVDARYLLGGTHDLIAELRALTAEYPLDEALSARLMLALARAGRQGDALAVFTQTRDTLVRQLGVEPGDELRQAQSEVLKGKFPYVNGLKNLLTSDNATVLAASTPVTPRQLPPAVPGFTGRFRHLGELDTVLAISRKQEAIALSIAVITGDEGVGKTALATHWAQCVSAEFPDGQIFADLLGHDARRARSPVAILKQFVRAMCPAMSQMPASLEELTYLYRSLLAGKRVLVVLDNAYDTQQVQPLLPGSGDCFVLVTSRYELTELLSAHGARRLSLNRLDEDEAGELVRHVMDLEQVHLEPSVITRIVARAQGLPLVLRRSAHEAIHQRLRPNLWGWKCDSVSDLRVPGATRPQAARHGGERVIPELDHLGDRGSRRGSCA